MNSTSIRIIIRESGNNHSPTEVYSRGFPYSVIAPTLPPNPFFTNRLSLLGLSLPAISEENVSNHSTPVHFLAKEIQRRLQEDINEQKSLRTTLETSYRTMYMNMNMIYYTK